MYNPIWKSIQRQFNGNGSWSLILRFVQDKVQGDAVRGDNASGDLYTTGLSRDQMRADPDGMARQGHARSIFPGRGFPWGWKLIERLLTIFGRGSFCSRLVRPGKEMA